MLIIVFDICKIDICTILTINGYTLGKCNQVIQLSINLENLLNIQVTYFFINIHPNWSTNQRFVKNIEGWKKKLADSIKCCWKTCNINVTIFPGITYSSFFQVFLRNAEILKIIVF